MTEINNSIPIKIKPGRETLSFDVNKPKQVRRKIETRGDQDNNIPEFLLNPPERIRYPGTNRIKIERHDATKKLIHKDITNHFTNGSIHYWLRFSLIAIAWDKFLIASSCLLTTVVKNKLRTRRKINPMKKMKFEAVLNPKNPAK